MTAPPAPRLVVRLGLAGLAALLVVLAGTALALLLLFDRHIERAAIAELDVPLAELAAAVTIAGSEHVTLVSLPADPRFRHPLSGRYWQVSDGVRPLLRSRSLWDGELALPPDRLAPGILHVHRVAGPGGQQVILVEQLITAGPAGSARALRLSVAADRAPLLAARRAFALEMAVMLSLLGGLLVIGGWLQLRIGLAPLARLRSLVEALRERRAARLAPGLPREVQPLVDAVNLVLDARDRMVEQARHRAADLAHGLKTPLTALLADADRLRASGQTEVAASLAETAQQMRRTVERELARARAETTRSGEPGPGTAVRALVEGLSRTLTRALGEAAPQFVITVPQTVQVAVPASDLAEILGNLLDNAARHARSSVQVDWEQTGVMPGVLAVCDDGIGGPPEAIDAVLARGARGDESPGAGLGLAITRDLLEAYGARLEIGRNQPSGWCVRVHDLVVAGNASVPEGVGGR